MRRKLTTDEAALWKRVIASVTPLHAVRTKPADMLPPEKIGSGGAVSSKAANPAPAARAKAPPGRAEMRSPQPLPKKEGLDSTLDGSWDRKFARGMVAPESSIDLHGHTLASAYDRLDKGLELAIQRGDRVLLLITGKPPRPESERPHARGAIRAAVGDWLASSRHAERIAAVRGAHPRHGGSGALYIVLRRPRPVPSRKS